MRSIIDILMWMHVGKSLQYYILRYKSLFKIFVSINVILSHIWLITNNIDVYVYVCVMCKNYL